jgi:hypothetical protein
MDWSAYICGMRDKGRWLRDAATGKMRPKDDWKAIAHRNS